jgi:phosphate transport system substrate-binding protein
VREVTLQQLAAMFSGSTTRWSSVGGTDTSIQLINRPNQHLRGTFEQLLGIAGRIPASVPLRESSDQGAISSVAGSVSAMTYTSLGVALDAVMYGVGVALLNIDKVEPAKQTVKDGRCCYFGNTKLVRQQNPLRSSRFRKKGRTSSKKCLSLTPAWIPVFTPRV